MPARMSQGYTVVYFDARARAEPIRLLLHYVGVPFEDRGLTFDQWAAHKAETPLGQLPYLLVKDENGERKIPQAMAILRHLARVHGLEGKTEAERLAADVASETVVDVRAAFNGLRFSPAWADEAAKAKFGAETAPAHLARIDKLLGDRAFFAADGPLWVDLYAFDGIDRLVATWPTVLDAFPRLAAFKARVEALPQLAKYLASRRPA
jgi:glutathione S-transferase